MRNFRKSNEGDNMNNKIGRYIAKLRKEKNLTQEELGKKLYVTGSSVSKWERGLSFPDITILEKLASELGVEVTDILNRENTITNKKDIEKQIDKLKAEIAIKNKKRIIVFTSIITILSIIILYLLLININFGYNIKTIKYEHSNRNINIAIPSLTIDSKSNDRSYSFKSLSSKNVLNSELKKYFSTLKYSTCKNTVYYYNEQENFSIIDYSIKDNIIYRTVSYEIVEYDYCEINTINEYASKLGGLLRVHLYNDGAIKMDETEDEKLVIILLDGSISPENTHYDQTLNMEVYYYKNIQNFIKHKVDSMDRETLEISTGNFEIKNNMLYYYRKDINEQSKNIKIPNVTVFEILDGGKLKLIDDYLNEYSKDIVLE